MSLFSKSFARKMGELWTPTDHAMAYGLCSTVAVVVRAGKHITTVGTEGGISPLIFPSPNPLFWIYYCASGPYYSIIPRLLYCTSGTMLR